MCLEHSGGTSAPSEYQRALDRTAVAVRDRARNYRDLVVAVALIGLGAVAAALVAGSPRALAALLLVLPACAAGYWRDARLLDAWRGEVLAPWAARTLDVAAFGAAVRAHPALPRATVEGMLATLPDAGDLVAEQRVAVPTRRAVAAASEAMHRARTRDVLLALIAGCVTAAAAMAAAATRTWTPLTVLAPLVLLPPGAALLRRRARAVVARELAARRGQPDFDTTAYARLLASVRT